MIYSMCGGAIALAGGPLLGQQTANRVLLAPIILVGALAGIAFIIGRIVRRRSRRQARVITCPSCAYDLTGITGPCPECGKERQA
ncbi:MAG TPA: hypothetical protein VFF65_05125 [Phycisphaerales bacterium]|nr:hypothetical protein [Phycisphaerales bacterium]